ncbi:VOC family protein [Crocosphaera sp. XPORK-15E]|uniref:VOC family protein n=1 Tax=Crocosphaera sp. XPORK-15E TaxID=3110247 RepID=UPI002B22095C|nr:VOC family protein [Crocosphaera sp. XPORK-15E]MEA5537330.1 VOC family protein [Crocosphaera sp. XPORK-15E]
MSYLFFHLAFPILNLSQAKDFYVEGLGCQIGRETSMSLILNLYNHQIVAHLTPEPLPRQKGVYPRHFGLIFLEESDWEALLKRGQNNQLNFYSPPKRRFIGTPIEHHTFFLEDPFFNLLEFKFYCQPEAIFGGHDFPSIGDRLLE